MDEAERGVNFLAAKFETLLQDLERVRGESANWKAKYESLENRCRTSAEAAAAQAGEWKTTLASRTAERDVLRRNAERAEKARQELATELQSCAAERDKWRDQCSSRERTIQQLDKRLAAQQDAAKRPQQENARLLTFNSQFSREVTEVRGLNQRLEKELALARADLDVSRRKCVAVSEHRGRDKTEYQKVKEEKDRLKEELRAQLKCNADLRGCLQAEKDAAKRAGKQLASLKLRLQNIRYAKNCAEKMVDRLSEEMQGYQQDARQVDRVTTDLQDAAIRRAEEECRKLAALEEAAELRLLLDLKSEECAHLYEQLALLEAKKTSTHSVGVVTSPKVLSLTAGREDSPSPRSREAQRFLEDARVALGDVEMEKWDLQAQVSQAEQDKLQSASRLSCLSKRVSELEKHLLAEREAGEREREKSDRWRREAERVIRANRFLRDQSGNLRRKMEQVENERRLRYPSLAHLHPAQANLATRSTTSYSFTSSAAADSGASSPREVPPCPSPGGGTVCDRDVDDVVVGLHGGVGVESSGTNATTTKSNFSVEQTEQHGGQQQEFQSEHAYSAHLLSQDPALRKLSQSISLLEQYLPQAASQPTGGMASSKTSSSTQSVPLPPPAQVLAGAELVVSSALRGEEVKGEEQKSEVNVAGEQQERGSQSELTLSAMNTAYVVEESTCTQSSSATDCIATASSATASATAASGRGPHNNLELSSSAGTASFSVGVHAQEPIVLGRVQEDTNVTTGTAVPVPYASTEEAARQGGVSS
ncbi:unnamed protein product [Amoebophrya sp. A120]|nr:unnamed protein product [Amoebophrya sp. A120]|eukprot:GSA120T00021630001.1